MVTTVYYYVLLFLVFSVLGINRAIIKQDKEYAEKNKESVALSGIFLILGTVSMMLIVFEINTTLLWLLLLWVFLAGGLLVYNIAALVTAKKAHKNNIPLSDVKFLDTHSARKKVFSYFKSDSSGKLNFGKRSLIVLLPIVSISYMITVFGVYELFFANLNDWKFVFKDIAIPSIIVFISFSLIAVFLIALIFRGECIKPAAVFLAAFAVVSYIQNAVLNRKLIIDGTEYPDSEAYGVKGLLNYSIWFFVCFGAVFAWIKFKKKRSGILKFSIWISGSILILQLAPLITFFTKAPATAFDKSDQKRYVLNGASQFEVSDNENIIVLIMDTFSRDDMVSFLESHSEYREKLADCVWFDNVNTESFYTAFSMPSLLTATQQDYTLGLEEANKKCWNSENAEYFYNTLHQNGFKVRLYTDLDLYSGGAVNMIGKIDNVIEAPDEVTEKWNTYEQMLKLSLFKYLPEITKPDFFVSSAYMINQYTHLPAGKEVDSSSWRQSMETAKARGICYLNVDIVENLNDGLQVNKEDKICDFMHINGMHEPFDKGMDKDSTIKECVDIYLDYTNQLKDIGVYDNSTIILTADHGYHDLNGNPPVMVIKPKNYTGDVLTVNSSPGNLQTDLLATIFDCQGLDKGDLGTSLFELDPNQERRRVCRDFRNDKAYPKAKKIRAIGNACYNCYDEYEYYGDVEHIDNGDNYKTYPIQDYWW